MILNLYQNIYCLFIYLFFCYFFGPLPQHMEVPRLGVESELQPPAYTRATAMRDPSRVCNLHHSSRQRRIVNPLSHSENSPICLLLFLLLLLQEMDPKKYCCDLCLRIQHCRELEHRLQTRLGSGVSVAVVQACGYSSNWTPTLGTSICHRFGPKKQNKKQKNQKIPKPHSQLPCSSAG